MKRKGRRLSAEEEKLWKRITDTATPMERRRPFEPISLTQPKAPETRQKRELPTFRVGEKATSKQTETRIDLPDQPLRMDRKAFVRMKRGKSSPEGRIDLHGMTVDVAHSALLAFLLRSHAEGKRLVLVITGKGRMREDGRSGLAETGILKRQVPHWLEQPPLRQIVLQVSTAHQRHGGSGALYVYLRR